MSRSEPGPLSKLFVTIHTLLSTVRSSRASSRGTTDRRRGDTPPRSSGCRESVCAAWSDLRTERSSSWSVSPTFTGFLSRRALWKKMLECVQESCLPIGPPLGWMLSSGPNRIGSCRQIDAGSLPGGSVGRRLADVAPSGQRLRRRVAGSRDLDPVTAATLASRANGILPLYGLRIVSTRISKKTTRVSPSRSIVALSVQGAHSDEAGR